MSEFVITVFNNGKRLNICAERGDLLIDLLTANGITVPASCGRRGTCSKCTVKLISGHFEGVTPDENCLIKSCKAVVCGNAQIHCNFESGNGLTENAFSAVNSTKSGAAIDIGNTTVAAAYLSKNGQIQYSSCLNPQSTYGADVISRIKACADGHLNEMTALIRNCIHNLLDELNCTENIATLAVSGNTTMLHLFCGISPESMGHSPFLPQFTDYKIINGTEYGFNVKNIIILPSVSAFIGADITAGAYSLNLAKEDENVLFADLGTNGEIVLSKHGELYCTSTAAGPALEGACIECGCGGINGAIDSVENVNGSIKYTTVGNAEPAGICGSGIVDTVTYLLENKLIDETGYFEDEKLTITDNIYFTQKDIRQFQLAKSAIYSGIETICEAAELKMSEIDRLYIAGGLGYYINPESAVNCGLLPGMDTNKIIPAGNTSLQGALNCLTSPEVLNEMQKLTEKFRLIDLGGNPKFNERFMENMYF